MSAHPPTSSGGFSLIEVALSLAILAVGMVGVLALLPVGLDGARQVHAETVAAQIVRGAIADFSTNSFSPNGYPLILGVPNGGILRTEYFGREGEVGVGQANAYFRLDYVKGTGGATTPSCRYFLRLYWPSGAPTNSAMVQMRTFVTDVVRNF